MTLENVLCTYISTFVEGLGFVGAGWGQSNSEIPPTTLLKVELKVIDEADCVRRLTQTGNGYEKWINEREICSHAPSDEDWKGSCYGDSGIFTIQFNKMYSKYECKTLQKTLVAIYKV